MSRLDHHVSVVRGRLGLVRFLDAIAWGLFAVSIGVVITIIIGRVLQYYLPHAAFVLLVAMLLAAVAAAIVGVMRRPDSLHAAVMIDERLELKEKFSTALHLRGVNDPFAIAAVRDAEATANSVSLAGRFPIALPRSGIYTGVAVVVALCLWAWLPEMDLAGHKEEQKKIAFESEQKQEAKKVVEKALAAVNAVPQSMANDETIKIARRDLENLASAPIKDTAAARRSAMKALEQTQEAMKQNIASNQKYAEAQNQAKMFQSLGAPVNEKGPVADAQRAMIKGDFSEAIDDLQKTVENFDKMNDQEKKDAANQMQRMAQQLAQMAKDPSAGAQQQMQKQLQQAGMNQQQAQQLTQKIQQAAQGDKQAQQQLQQMAQQAMQNMTPQQQQAMQQAMQQMQAQANTQQQAQQMAQAAQQMAQAMNAAAQAKPQGPQQARQNQSAQQQAAAQQAQQAAQQMQQQMQQMQAMKSDAAQVAAAQQAAQQAAANAAGGQQGQGQGQAANGQNKGGNGNQGQGQWANQGGNQGNPQGKWNGQGANQMGPNQGGQGAGDRSGKQWAPFAVKQEIDPSQDIEAGKLLASTFVKAGTVKGESKETLKQVAQAAERDATDEIDQEHVSKQAQGVVKAYFNSIQKDAQ
jgi:hypothetical protein